MDSILNLKKIRQDLQDLMDILNTLFPAYRAYGHARGDETGFTNSASRKKMIASVQSLFPFCTIHKPQHPLFAQVIANFPPAGRCTFHGFIWKP
jgi:hypothetical protein